MYKRQLQGGAHVPAAERQGGIQPVAHPAEQVDKVDDVLDVYKRQVRPSMEFYLHFSLDMDRSPGFGPNATNWTPFSDSVSLRLQTLSP